MWQRPPLVLTVMTHFAEELCRLASDPGTAPDIAEEAIPTIVGLLKASTKPSAEAAKALNELAKHQPAIKRPPHADLIREAGGIPALVALIPSADGDEELLRTRAATEAAGALWSLLHDNEENRKALREANGIPALVKMLEMIIVPDSAVKIPTIWPPSVTGKRSP